MKLIYGDEGLVVVDNQGNSEKCRRHEGLADGFAVPVSDLSNVARGMDGRQAQQLKRNPVPEVQKRLYQPVGE